MIVQVMSPCFSWPTNIPVDTTVLIDEIGCSPDDPSPPSPDRTVRCGDGCHPRSPPPLRHHHHHCLRRGVDGVTLADDDNTTTPCRFFHGLERHQLRLFHEVVAAIEEKVYRPSSSGPPHVPVDTVVPTDEIGCSGDDPSSTPSDYTARRSDLSHPRPPSPSRLLLSSIPISCPL